MIIVLMEYYGINKYNYNINYFSKIQSIVKQKNLFEYENIVHFIKMKNREEKITKILEM